MTEHAPTPNPTPAEQHHIDPGRPGNASTASKGRNRGGPGRRDLGAVFIDQILAACRAEKRGRAFALLGCLLLAEASAGALLHRTVPGQWPLGATAAGVFLAAGLVRRRWAGRAGRPPVWVAEADKHQALITIREPRHVVQATDEFRNTVASSGWRWAGVHVLSLDCPHPAPCADHSCTNLNRLVRGSRVLLVLGRRALAEATGEQARAVLLHEAAHARGWQPVATAIPTIVLFPGVFALGWAVPPAWLAPALIAALGTIVAIRWLVELAADWSTIRAVDPRATADFIDYDAARLRANPRSMPSRVICALLPHPPMALRARILRSRAARRRYHRTRRRR